MEESVIDKLEEGLEPKQAEESKETEEIKEEEKVTKTKRRKDLISEMRGLLTQYPLDIGFVEATDSFSLAKNLLLIYDLLVFCRYKTVKEEIKLSIESELNILRQKVLLSDLKSLLIRYSSSNTNYLKSRMKKQIHLIILGKSLFISDKVQLYALAIPSRGKRDMHLKTAQGLPAALAEDYESTEIQEGEKVKEGQAFKFDDEGRVFTVD